MVNFLIESVGFIAVNDSISDLLIIACLQTILSLDKEDFKKYKFHLYQNQFKKVPATSSVLRSHEHLSDAKQIYLTTKVLNQLYANAGMYEARKKLQSYLRNCYKIIKRILQRENIDDMLELHNKHINEQYMLLNSLATIHEIDTSLQSMELYLKDQGFVYEGEVLCFEEKYINDALISYINCGLIFKQPELLFQLIHNEKGNLFLNLITNNQDCISNNENIIMNFKLIFDYENKICTLSNFKNFAT